MNQSPLYFSLDTPPVASLFLLRAIVVVIVVITVFIALFLYCILKFIHLFGYPAAV